jgi:hypothetical protein
MAACPTQNLLNPNYHVAYWLGLQGNDSTLSSTNTYTWVDPYAPDLQRPSSYKHWLSASAWTGPSRRLLDSSPGANDTAACGTAQLQQVFGLAAGWKPANCSELRVFIVKIRRGCCGGKAPPCVQPLTKTTHLVAEPARQLLTLPWPTSQPPRRCPRRHA